MSSIAPATTPPTRFGVLRGRIPLPWATVAALAVVLAFANGFVLVTLQGAVGAIERTQDPFGNWLRYSAILIPAVALTVTWALARAHRRGHRTLTTVVLIAAATTTLGITAMIISSAYDYHLQADLLAKTASLHVHTASGNTANTAANSAYDDGGWSPEQRQTMLITIKADTLGIALLATINLILTGWITALLGGRLRIPR